MKRNLIIYLLGILMGGVNIGLAQPKYNAAYLQKKNDSFNALFKDMTDNGWLYFKDEQAARIAPDEFLKKYAANLGLTEGYTLKIVRDEDDKDPEIKEKMRHQFFQLYYRDVPVEGGEFFLHSKANVLSLAHGRIIAGLEVDVSKPMDMPVALEKALAEQKLTRADFNEKEIPAGTLVLTRRDEHLLKESYSLAYSFELKGERIKEPHQVFIDATTGNVIKKIPLIMRCFAHSGDEKVQESTSGMVSRALLERAHAPLVASTIIPNYARYLNGQGNLGIETDQVGSQFRLSAYNGQLVTRTDANGNGQWDDSDMFNPTTDWSNNNRNATTAHYLALKVHQMYSTQFGLNGYNEAGAYPHVLVDLPAVDAYWDLGNMIVFGRAPNNQSLVTADVVGHEYTHAVIQHRPGLVYAGESGALNESIADIMGTTLEFQLLGPNANYGIAEDADQLRSMDDPRQSFTNWGNAGHPQPDFYLGPDWLPNNSPLGNGAVVHRNSGVMNKWYWFFRTGGPTGTAHDELKPAKSVYRAMQFYLGQHSTYQDAANATRQGAIDVYGACSDIARQAVYAWGLVGITVPPSCPSCNITSTAASATPATVSPGQQVTLSSNCAGDCNHLTLANWSGPTPGTTSVGTGHNVVITAPTSPGTYTYNFGAFKHGCFPVWTSNTTITVSTPPTGGFDQCVESESSSGNGAITSDPNASNGQTRGEQNNYNHYVDYAISNVPSAGTYTVTLRYYSSADPVVSVQANGGSAQTVNLANSLSWNIVATTQTFNVTLNQGSNTIRIQGIGGGSCRQDKICVTGGGGGNPPSGDCYELRLASNQKRVTNVSGIVKVKDPIGSGNTQTWKLIPDGSHYRIMVQDGTSRVLGVESGGNSIGNIITLQNFNGQDHQLWTKQQISDGGPLDRYGFVRKNSSLIIHSEPNWGNGDTLNSVTDLKLTSGSDLNVYGRNKFYTDTKTCPTLRMGVEEAQAENNPEALTVSPNPNAGEFEAGFYLGVGKAATLSVINILGQTLYERGITGQGTHTEKVKLGSYVPGIFLVQLRSGKSVEVKKIIVVR